MKNIIIILLILSLFLGPCFGEVLPQENVAVENIIFEPMFTNISQFHAGLSISGTGLAQISASLDGHGGSNSKIVAKLQQFKNGSWVTINSFTSESSVSDCYMSHTYYVAKGYSYRTLFYAYVYSGQIMLDYTSLVSKTASY